MQNSGRPNKYSKGKRWFRLDLIHGGRNGHRHGNNQYTQSEMHQRKQYNYSKFLHEFKRINQIYSDFYKLTKQKAQNYDETWPRGPGCRVGLKFNG